MRTLLTLLRKQVISIKLINFMVRLKHLKKHQLKVKKEETNSEAEVTLVEEAEVSEDAHRSCKPLLARGPAVEGEFLGLERGLQDLRFLVILVLGHDAPL